MDIPIYCISYNNIIRKNNMIEKFNKIDLKLKFINDISFDDPKMKIHDHVKCSHIILQHLNCINDYLNNSTNEYCIVCEDDVYISKNLKNDLPNIVKNFEENELDILLLGYLYPYSYNNSRIIKDFGYLFCEYDNNVWGTQMYLITRKYAKFLIDNYFNEDKIKDLKTPFAADWVITKNGNRARLYPMVAVEDGINDCGHHGQNEFHRICCQINYKQDIFI